MTFLRLIIVGVLSVAGLTACKHLGGGSYHYHYTPLPEESADNFKLLLEADSGQPYIVSKQYTAKDGFVVFQNQITGKYVAYNMKIYDSTTMLTLADYMAVARPDFDFVTNLTKETVYKEGGYWDDVYESVWEPNYVYDTLCSCYVDKGSYRDHWVSQRWVDTSGYYSYYKNGFFTFEDVKGETKDLEYLASMEETTAKKLISTKLREQFSFSGTRADELANSLIRYRKLENSRELTFEEKSVFATEAFGSSLADLEKALVDKAQGKEETYKKLLDRAAEVNHTTPEKIGELFNGYINQ